MAFSGPQALARTLSLQEALALALDRNEQILVAQEDQRRAKGAVVEAYAGAMPSLSFQAQYTGNLRKPAFFLPAAFFDRDDSSGHRGPVKIEVGSDTEFTGALRLEQTVYAFGRVGNAVKYAQLYQDIATLGVASARSDVIFNVTSAYYRVLLLQKLLEIQQQSLRQAEAHLRNVEEKFRQGSQPRFAVQRAQVEVRQREPLVIQAQSQLTLAMQDLKRLVGISDEPDPVLTDTLAYQPLHLEVEDAVREALAQRPEIRILELNLKGQERILAISRASRLPVVGAFGQVLFQGQADKEDLGDAFDENRQISVAAGLVCSAPLFDGFRTKGKVEQAQASLRKARHQLSQARKTVRLEVTKAVQDLEGISREYEAQRATVALAEEMYQIALTRFQNGISTQLELADAELALNAARTSYAETLYRYNVALANVHRALGRTALLAPSSGGHEQKEREIP